MCVCAFKTKWCAQYNILWVKFGPALPGVTIHPLAFNLVSGRGTEKQPVWLHIMHMHMPFCVLEAAATVVTSREEYTCACTCTTQFVSSQSGTC